MRKPEIRSSLTPGWWEIYICARKTWKNPKWRETWELIDSLCSFPTHTQTNKQSLTNPRRLSMTSVRVIDWPLKCADPGGLLDCQVKEIKVRNKNLIKDIRGYTPWRRPIPQFKSRQVTKNPTTLRKIKWIQTFDILLNMSNLQPKLTRPAVKLKSESCTQEKKNKTVNGNQFWVGPDVGFCRQSFQSSYCAYVQGIKEKIKTKEVIKRKEI